MPNHGIATAALLALLLLAGCGGTGGDMAYSQQRAIGADMDASFQHGGAADHDIGAQFNNSLDAASGDRTPRLGAALGFR